EPGRQEVSEREDRGVSRLDGPLNAAGLNHLAANIGRAGAGSQRRTGPRQCRIRRYGSCCGECRTCGLGFVLVHVLRYMPMVMFAEMDGELVSIIPDTDLAHARIRSRNGEFVSIREGLGVRDAPEVSQEETSEGPGERAQSRKLLAAKHRVCCRSNAKFT